MEDSRKDFPQHRVINRGFGGSQIVDSTHFAERIIFPYAPRMILLRAGGNDIHAGKSPELVFSDFRAFVIKVHEKLPDAEIAYIALSPSIARWDEKEKGEALNRMIREYTREIPGSEIHRSRVDFSGARRKAAAGAVRGRQTSFQP